MNSQDPKDRAFEEYLQGQSKYSRLYQALDKVEPKGHVDATILAAARRAVGSRPWVASRQFLSKWGGPVKIAAVLTLCVGLVVLIYDETGQSLFDRDPLEVIDGELRERIIAKDAVVEETEEGTTQSATDAQDRMRAAPQRHFQALPKKEASLLPSEDVADEINLPIGVGSTLKQKGRAEMPDAEVEFDAKSTHSMPLAEPEPVSPSTRTVAPSTAGQRDVEVDVGTEDIVTSTVEMDESVEKAILSPEDWLKEIKQLRATGQLREAEASLKRFKVAYPNYPDEDIRAILNSD